MTAAIRVEHHDSAATLKLRDEIVRVYAATHTDVAENPWYQPDRFWERLIELYAPGRDFGMVTAWRGQTVIGYAFGSPRDNTGQFWEKFTHIFPDIPVPPETASIYIFREFAVDPKFQRQGCGRILHDALLANRPEPVADLLVRKDNVPAQAAYKSWGWQKLGDCQPFEDSPIFDELILPLHLNRIN